MSPAFTAFPFTSMSATAVRDAIGTGDSNRISSSMTRGSIDGSLTTRCCSDGCCASQPMRHESDDATVSRPATMRR